MRNCDQSKITLCKVPTGRIRDVVHGIRNENNVVKETSISVLCIKMKFVKEKNFVWKVMQHHKEKGKGKRYAIGTVSEEFYYTDNW